VVATVVARRRGTSTLGCLFTLLILAAIGYFGVNVGRPVYRFLVLRDAMQQEVRYAGMRNDAIILRRLRAKADSLVVPAEAARNFRVRRTSDIIFIFTEYTEHVEFPGFVKPITFRPTAQGPF